MKIGKPMPTRIMLSSGQDNGYTGGNWRGREHLHTYYGTMGNSQGEDTSKRTLTHTAIVETVASPA